MPDPSLYSGAYAPPKRTGMTDPTDDRDSVFSPSFSSDAARSRSNPGTFSSAYNLTPEPPPTSVTSHGTPADSGPVASSAFSAAAPTVGQPAGQPNLIRDVLGPQLQGVSNKLEEAYAAPRPGMFRQVAGALLSRKNPAIGGLVSGETQRERTIQPLQQEYGLVSNQIAASRAATTADISNQEKMAQTNYLNARPGIAENTVEATRLKSRNAAESALQRAGLQGNYDENNELIGTTPIDASKLSAPAQATIGLKNAEADKADADKTPSEVDKAISDHLAATGQANTPANRDKTRSLLKTRDKPARDPDLADISLQLKQAQLEKLKEASPDEQRRSDLANNLDENLDKLEDIAKRRPELFGPLGGRMTGARQFVGTSDPDVAALKNIEEQTGLAMVGAHAMRNAQHAEKAAQSITGANHNTASVLLAPNGPIATARDSLKTFRGDVSRRRQQVDSAIGNTGGATAAPANPKDPLGIL